MLPGFLPQNQFVPVSYGPPPYAQLMEPPRFCAKCGRDATQEVVGGTEPQREQKNPFSQTERRNPFQHNPFQKGHDEKRRAPYAIRDMWKDGGDDGYGGKMRKEDEAMDGQEVRADKLAVQPITQTRALRPKALFAVRLETGPWKWAKSVFDTGQQQSKSVQGT
ncbi:hypothetical protein TELCIR_19868 [Teladorsagia circumcincta]|uniref:Uncharacterized protein n=1 Tax=Teladorsagia circumcincta TaxID=45464 RepID=A0A2G9TMJ5_TELCI|nr:hypothetical protein TELCIR_19868 [Teladorsagia circumcincta]